MAGINMNGFFKRQFSPQRRRGTEETFSFSGLPFSASPRLCGRWCLIVFILFFLTIPSFAAETKKEKTWWEKRENQAEIYYPHNAHKEVMEKKGDPCMICHPFSGTTIKDIKLLDKLTPIVNEPLLAICHSCHLEDLSATSECSICHKDPRKIWPEDHNYDYKNRHGEDARVDSEGCGRCHKSPSFCTDCHFMRDRLGRKVHGLGYRANHGIDARISPGECGKCHNSSYCKDCHRKMK